MPYWTYKPQKDSNWTFSASKVTSLNRVAEAPLVSNSVISRLSQANLNKTEKLTHASINVTNNVTKDLPNYSLINMPGSKYSQKIFFAINFAEKIIAAVYIQSLEFLRQVEQIEMVVIGSVIDGRHLAFFMIWQAGLIS